MAIETINPSLFANMATQYLQLEFACVRHPEHSRATFSTARRVKSMARKVGQLIQQQGIIEAAADFHDDIDGEHFNAWYEYESLRL